MTQRNSGETPERGGLTLIELLVVVTLLSLLVGLLLPAVQSARLAAVRMSNTSHMKQTVLAVHNYASANGDTLPYVDGVPDRDSGPLSVIQALCPHLEADRLHPPSLIRFQSDPSLKSTPNPSPFAAVSDAEPQRLVTSLAFNPYVLSKGRVIKFSVRQDKTITSSIPDGTSETVMVTEHYGFCRGAGFDWRHTFDECFAAPSMNRVPCSSDSQRRATFADGAVYQDVFPVTSTTETGSVSRGSHPLTFQVRPTLNECDPRLPQSSLPGGILCGFSDGSVRFVRVGVSEATFWGSITPAGGEVISLD